MKHQIMKFTFAAFKESCDRPVHPLRTLNDCRTILENKCIYRKGEGNGLGVVKPKAVMNQN